MKIFNKIIGKANEISNKFKSSSKIVEISNRVYHCPYPTNPQILKSMINQLGAEQLQIWNLSQYKYSKQTFEALVQLNFKVNQVTFEFYSSMPLTTSIRSINKIDKFLKSSQKNVVFIHCQQNKSRSVLFLAAYMYLTDQISDIATALAFVNQKLGIEGYQTVYSSQHLILRNIANFHKDPDFINRQQLKLMKVIISEAPTLPEITNYQDQSLMILIEIRRNAKIIYRKTAKQFGQGEIVQFNLKEENIILADDCLFSFKYVFKQKIHPVMRIQLNTNFIFNNFLRVQMQEIDFCRNVKSKGHVFADFLFSAEKNKQSELSKLSSKPISRSSVEAKEKNKRQNFSPKQLKQSKSQSKQKAKAIKVVEEQEKDMFHIHDQLNQKEREDKNQLDERQTQENIRRLMDSMAKKQAQKQQDLRQIERQICEIEQSAKIQSPSLSYQQNKKPEIQIISAETQTVQKLESKKDAELYQQEDDLDDYLSKLTQQVDDS